MEFRENIKTLLKGGAFSLKKKKKKDIDLERWNKYFLRSWQRKLFLEKCDTSKGMKKQSQIEWKFLQNFIF